MSTTHLDVPVDIRARKRKTLVKFTANYSIPVYRKIGGVCIETIKIPKGFVSDGASTPRFTWIFFPPFGEYLVAAVGHDFLYAVNRHGKKVADLLFKHIMIELDVAPWKRQIMYHAVKWFGWASWWKHRRRHKRGYDITNYMFDVDMDATDAMQAALTVANESGGGTVMVPKRTHTIRNRVTLRGLGADKTTIRTPSEREEK